ncbi:DNA polymerase III subunit delta [Pasteurellaceae bacterium RH1A]|nr:DNA polymerase III subunit delta [Pasteurellaceae bacterium RH1A]
MQRIFPEALAPNLERGLSPFYLLTGQDLLLVNEAKDAIVKAARQQDFDEKSEVTVASDTKWEDLIEQAQSNGLFFSRQILILNLPESLTVAQQKWLAELTALIHPDLLFIFHLPKFSKAVEKQGWLTQIEAQTIQINCQTPDMTKLPNWIQHRAKAMQLNLDREAIQLLAYSYEGNLLALKQAMQMLQLQFSQEAIGLQRAKEVVEQSAQFTPFQWIDALLEGKPARAQRILNHLRAEEVQTVVLLRILQKELITLLELTRSPNPILNSHQPLYAGNLRAEFDRLKVWQNRRGLYQQAINRLTYHKLYQLIQKLADLERLVKQEFNEEEVWVGLEKLSIMFVLA